MKRLQMPVILVHETAHNTAVGRPIISLRDSGDHDPEFCDRYQSWKRRCAEERKLGLKPIAAQPK